MTKRLAQYDKIKIIRGDIFEPFSYVKYLRISDIVVHLAAVTGKAKNREYFKVNVKGLETLLEQCKKCGVKRFLHISTIAVKYRNISHYPYAQSKKKAEELVKTSNIAYTILRPTVVLGIGSPMWRNLRTLGRLPFRLGFDDGEGRVQPIYIDDLIDCIKMIVNEDIFFNETYDIGGPEVISVSEFIRKIHRAFKCKEPRRINIPLRHIISLVLAVEKRFQLFLPVSAGQMSFFVSDGSVVENEFFRRTVRKMKRIDEMIRLLKIDESALELRKKLDYECKVFCRYLADVAPTSYIAKKYRDGNMATIVGNKMNIGFLNSTLIKISRRNLALFKLADAYTSMFARSSVLRKKTILLTAILECCPLTNHQFEIADSSGISLFFIKGFLKGIMFIFLLVASIAIFMPLHIIDAVVLRQTEC